MDISFMGKTQTVEEFTETVDDLCKKVVNEELPVNKVQRIFFGTNLDGMDINLCDKKHICIKRCNDVFYIDIVENSDYYWDTPLILYDKKEEKNSV